MKTVFCLLLVVLAGLTDHAVSQEESWEEWFARSTERVQFDDAEIEAFKADEQAYMVCKAIYEEDEERGGYFIIKALARFPDTTRLHFSLGYHDQQLEWTQVEVESGVARCILGPFGERRVLSGRYRVYLAFFHHKQRRKVLNFPGVPVREVRVETAVTVGDEERSIADLAARRRYYEDYMKKLRVLEAEQRKNVEAASAHKRFIIGNDETNFDVSAWRRWVTDWRERMFDKVGEQMRHECQEQVLALRFDGAYTILSSIVVQNMMASKAYSRVVYESFGRAIHPDDEPGIDEVGLPTIEGKLKDLHRRFDEYPWD